MNVNFRLKKASKLPPKNQYKNKKNIENIIIKNTIQPIK